MESYNYLFDSNYTRGSYNRETFKDYNLKYQLEYQELTIDVTTDNRLIKDHFMKELLDDGILSSDQYKEYICKLDEYVGDMQQFINCTNEEVCQGIHAQRLEVLTEKQLATMDNQRCKTITDADSQETKEQQLVIDDYQQYEELVTSCDAVLILPGSYTNAMTLKESLQTYLHRGKKIFILIKDNTRIPHMTFKDINNLLSVNPKYKGEQITTIKESSSLYGYDFSCVEHNEELQAYITENNVFIHGLGEWTLMDTKDLNIPSIVDLQVNNFYTRVLTNIPYGKSGRVYVPAHYSMMKYNPIIEVSTLNYFQLSELYKAYGQTVYTKTADELRSLYPGFFINQYSTMPKGDSPFQSIMSPDPSLSDYNIYYKKRRKNIEDYLSSGHENIQYFSKYFELNNFSEVPLIAQSQKEENNLLVDGVVMQSISESKVVLSEASIPQAPDMTLQGKIKDKGLYFISNFLFFLTPKIASHYNQLREGRPKEQIDLTTGHLDFRHCMMEGERVQTFPLYGKPSIYQKKDGTMGFSNFTLGAGELKVNDTTFAWTEDQVDTPRLEEDIIVYTPNGVEGRPTHHLNYVVSVGDGRVNLVIINNKVIALREGNVLLPHLGVVVSLSKKIALPWLESLSLSKDNNGYYTVDDLRLSIDLKAPKGWNQGEWNDIQWSFGGGLSLIRDNVSIFENEELAAKILEEEGWLNPLSMQTQESTIHELVRHPRTCLGLTGNNEFFILVFSGRTKISRGANYIECSKVAKKIFGDIKYMMNVDGGASSLLALVLDGEFMELSYPAASNNTCTGMARQLNSMLVIEV